MKLNIAIIQAVSINDHRMVHTDIIARELINRDYKVDVIILKSNEKPQFKNIPYNIKYISGKTYSIIGQLKFMYDLYMLLRKSKYDIIHAKNPFSSIFPVLLYDSKIKSIYDIRGLWIEFGVHKYVISNNLSNILKILDKLCMKNVNRILAISYELKNILIKKGIDKDKIDVIVGDCVDIERIRNINTKDIHNESSYKGIIIGYVGGIGSSRNSERIIEAFKIVHEKLDAAKLIMVGPCRQKKYFQKYVTSLGLQDCIFFTGFIPHDEAIQFMKFFDVAVAYHEGDLPIFNVAVPTKILEYLACGCSIVTTDQKMYRSILTHKKDGFLTNQNPKSYAEGILQVLSNKKLSKNLSKNALITAENYSYKKYVDKLENVYKKVLNTNNGKITF